MYGLREKKYEYLNKINITSTKWERLKPSEPYCFFVPKDFALQAEYEKFWKVNDIFHKSSFGVTTSRDHFVVGFTKEEVIHRTSIFTGNLTDELVKRALNLEDTETWELSSTRQMIKGQQLEENIHPYAYRPFDNRWICYNPLLIERDRKDVMQHIQSKENFGLNLTRRLRDQNWDHVYVTDSITDKTLLSSRDNCYFFPLYLYPETNNSEKKSSVRNLMLFEPQADYGARKANLSPIIIEQLTKSFKKTPSPEQIFFYIYAILYSNIYRTKYSEFLKIDFPRIPFTNDYKLFLKMADYGKRLVDLHLLKSPEINPPIAKFQGKGDNKVEKLRYEPTRLFINENQYFEGIEPQVFEYQIGGYQVCEKWLKDRKDRKLALDEIKHYCNIATAVKKTIEIQKLIDVIYPKIEEETIRSV